MTDDRSSTIRLVAFQSAVVLLAATRLPGGDGTMTLLAAASAALVAGLAAAVTLWRRAPPGLRAWLFVAALAAVLVPPSHDAVLAWLPDWLPALAFVLALHGFFRGEARRAPELGGRHEGGRRHVLRFLPAAVAVAAIVAAPLALVLLPARVGAAYELHTALAPLAPLALLGGLLVAGGALRGLLGRGARAEPASTPEGEAA